MMIRSYAVMIIIMLVAGCASIEGTRDKSMTVNRIARIGSTDSVSILPIREHAAIHGLSSQIETALAQSFRRAFPQARVIDAQTFGTSLARGELVSAYSQWRTNYESTSILDPRPLNALHSATNSRYFLFVPSVHLARERIRATDTGYRGTVSDARNVWRTDLRVSAELIDASSGQVVWKGGGHAENIHSPRRPLDLGLVIINQRNPEVIEFIGQLVQTLADGVADQVAGNPRQQ